MNKSAYFAVFFHNFHHVFGEILGVARHKPHAEFSLNRSNRVQKLGKRHARAAVCAVGIDVLT